MRVPLWRVEKSDELWHDNVDFSQHIPPKLSSRHVRKRLPPIDAARDARLDAQGFRILRLPNALVTGSAEWAVERSRLALAI
jgi:hypothetical protein